MVVIARLVHRSLDGGGSGVCDVAISMTGTEKSEIAAQKTLATTKSVG